MSDENAPADDLRSILSASFDQAAAADPVEPVAKAEPEAPKADAAEAEPKAGSRERGPDGKFAKKDGEEPDTSKSDAAKTKEEPKANEDKTAAKVDEPKPDDKPDAKGAADSKEAPTNWSSSDKAMFKLQSPEAQAFLLRRNREMDAAFTKKSEALSGLQKEFGPIDEMFKPHLETLKAKGLTPAATIRAWANVETALANGRGVDIVAGMIKGYNIDKAAVAKALGFTSTGTAQPGTEPATGQPDTTAAGAQPINLPPELANELRELRAKIDARDQTDQQSRLAAVREREAAVESDISKFKSEANEAGELKHPFFEEVEPAMIALASSYVASKQPIPPLAELYETAVWANPSTRQATLAAQKAAEESKRAEEARAKAASARRAGSSVTGAPGSGQASKPIRGEQSLRESLEEAAADLG